jgi:hypothetical protein
MAREPASTLCDGLGLSMIFDGAPVPLCGEHRTNNRTLFFGCRSSSPTSVRPRNLDEPALKDLLGTLEKRRALPLSCGRVLRSAELLVRRPSRRSRLRLICVRSSRHPLIACGSAEAPASRAGAGARQGRPNNTVGSFASRLCRSGRSDRSYDKSDNVQGRGALSWAPAVRRNAIFANSSSHHVHSPRAFEHTLRYRLHPIRFAVVYWLVTLRLSEWLRPQSGRHALKACEDLGAAPNRS